MDLRHVLIVESDIVQSRLMEWTGLLGDIPRPLVVINEVRQYSLMPEAYMRTCHVPPSVS
jgi:hypothetical protein